jgi:hypothetical protein
MSRKTLREMRADPSLKLFAEREAGSWPEVYRAAWQYAVLHNIPVRFKYLQDAESRASVITPGGARREHPRWKTERRIRNLIAYLNQIKEDIRRERAFIKKAWGKKRWWRVRTKRKKSRRIEKK